MDPSEGAQDQLPAVADDEERLVKIATDVLAQRNLLRYPAQVPIEVSNQALTVY